MPSVIPSFLHKISGGGGGVVPPRGPPRPRSATSLCHLSFTSQEENILT